MRLQSLETLLAIAMTESFSNAALKLNLTQSTVSARIRDLETDLGIALFDRRGRKVNLTPQGREVLKYAEKIVQLTDELRQAVSNRAELSGEIRIGVVEFVAVTWLREFVASVSGDHPRLTVDFEIGLNPDLYRSLMAHNLDFMIVAGENQDASLRSEFLHQVDFHWLAGPGIVLPDRPLTREELARFPIIQQGRNSFLGREAARWINRERNAWRPETSCTSLMGLAALVSSGAGLALMPTAAFRREIEAGSLRVVQTDPPAAQIAFSFCYRYDTDPVLAEKLLELAKYAIRISAMSDDDAAGGGPEDR